MNKFSFKKILIVVGLIGVLVLLGLSGYFFYQYQSIKKQFDQSPLAAQKMAQAEVKRWVTEVGSLMVLPNEDPTVATVSDVKKLQGQAFFKQAKNGDKVLLFAGAKLAVLYDPVIKKIVNVGPINVGNQSQANQATAAKIVLRNGTNMAGLTATAEAELKKAFPGIAIAKKEQAAKVNYEKTVVVVFNSTAKNAAETLAKFYGVSVGELPSEEVKPKDGDILVILGKDFALNESSLTPSPPASTP